MGLLDGIARRLNHGLHPDTDEVKVANFGPARRYRNSDVQPLQGPEVMAVDMRYNSITGLLEKQRGNEEGELLASAARTAQTDSATMTNRGAKGVILWLNVTAASGTGGLQPYIQGHDPGTTDMGTRWLTLTSAPTIVTATGLYGYAIYPGIANAGIRLGNNMVLPRVWRARVVVGDASSYTYSLSYGMVL